MNTRAEEKAQEYASNCILTVDHEGDAYDAYFEGYRQAEEDLTLTWQDMKLVIAAEGSIYDEHHGNSSEVLEAYPTEEAFYGEVLRRFLELKENEKDPQT